jgi:DNA (cytosine-5)-methyltransferase 1
MKQIDMFSEIIVDNFAGGGGASTGIELAIGRSVDIAINHDPAAIAMHKANHPTSEHYIEDVWQVDPVKACKGRPVALAWFSPDCKHFSKAKGGKPVEKKIRGLAWVAVKWAKKVHPRVIILENVEEFKTWGPLIPKTDKSTGRILKKAYRSDDDDVLWDEVVSGQGEIVPPELQIMMPDPERKGETFNLFIKALERLGYVVDFRELRACDYGAPTIRKRFFMVARCDGKPIVWPEPTHGNPESLEVRCGLLKPWRTAAEIIDWSLPCPSIFERKKPLAENTLKRIAKGIQKYVIENPEPFIMVNTTGHPGSSIEEPLSTIVSKAEHLLVAPILSQYHTETANAEARGQVVDSPIMTLDASNRYALVSAFISKYFGGYYKGAGSAADEPIHTLTTKERNAVVTSHLIQMNNHMDGKPLTQPLSTIVAGPGNLGEVRTFLMSYYGNGEDVGQRTSEPLRTVTTKDRFGIVMVEGKEYQIVDIGMRMLEPHELFKAQGFPEDYIIDHDFEGKPYPKTAQVARCGNAVPPPFAEALTRANLPELCDREDTGRYYHVV